jgi:hypothetical protein
MIHCLAKRERQVQRQTILMVERISNRMTRCPYEMHKLLLLPRKNPSRKNLCLSRLILSNLARKKYTMMTTQSFLAAPFETQAFVKNLPTGIKWRSFPR